MKIGVIGKYVHLKDAYKSLHEALVHGGLDNGVSVELQYIDSELLTADNVSDKLGSLAGILVPGGFGDRGVEGKIEAIRYARENAVPYFGICLGMQLAVLEFARNVCGLTDATSREFTKEPTQPVIDLMPDQIGVSAKGATMRLGSWDCKIKPGTLAADIYGSDFIQERHRHRFEVNNDYRDTLEAGGLVLCGTSPDGRLVEMIELNNHPHFIGCQFHPEFKSRPMDPHPLFKRFVRAACVRRDRQMAAGTGNQATGVEAEKSSSPAPVAQHATAH